MKDNQLVSRVNEMFADENIDFSVLKDAFHGIAKYFTGTTPGKINNYPNGVKSVVIEGLDCVLPSTFGYLPKGDFEFNTGQNQETMHYLIGNLSWGVKGKEIIVPNQYDKLVILAGEDLVLNVENPSLYLCDYLKQ